MSNLCAMYLKYISYTHCILRVLNNFLFLFTLLHQARQVSVRSIFVQALTWSPAGPSSFSTSLSEAGVKMVSLVAKITSKIRSSSRTSVHLHTFHAHNVIF